MQQDWCMVRRCLRLIEARGNSECSHLLLSAFIRIPVISG